MSDRSTPIQPEEADPVQRASQVFENWLVRDGRGEGEPFEQLLARNPELKGSLERLRRMDAFVREAIQHTTPEALPTETRARMLGDYRVMKEIGRGAMGIVFEAEQMSLHRRVALKVLPAHLTLNERALTRFQHEAEITAKLNHRNIISIHQVGEVAGVHFIAMELIEGTSLDKVIERMRRESFDGVRPRKIGDVVSMHGLEDAPALTPAPKPASAKPPSAKPASASTRAERGSGSKRGSSSASNKNFIESAVKLVCHVADALHHAHQAGVIHRDVKPSNILVRPDGSPVLTDFGLAREDGLPSVSQTGDFAGTPNFVSPEQAMSGRVPVDHRADIFSLGATLYELLTLEQAFPGETIHEILSRIITKQPVEPHKLNPALAPDLVTIVMKALEKDPDRRYANAADFAEDLRSFIEYRPIRAKRTPTVMRAWRWARREPLKAALAAVLGIGVPVTAVLGGKLIVANARIHDQSGDQREKEIKQAFLDLGLARDGEAEQALRGLLAREDVRGTERELVTVVGLARALLNQDRFEDAERFLSEHQRGATPVPVLERLRADALRRMERASEAAAIEARLSAPATHLDKYVEALRLLGGTSYARAPGLDARTQERERAHSAAALLQEAVIGDNERASYYFAWAWAASVAGDPAIARLVLNALPSKWQDEPFAWFYAGVAREVVDEKGALEAYAEASRLDPERVGPEARLRMATLRLARDPAGAAEDFAALAREQPERVDFQASLAVAWVHGGQFEAALEAADAALALDPEREEALDARGGALAALGRNEEAREAYAKAARLYPEDSGHHIGLGQVLTRLGALDRALEHLETARRLDPESPLPPLCLAEMHIAGGEVREAEALLIEALALHDEQPSPALDAAYANEWLARCQSQLGRLDEALASAERSFELAPARAESALLFGQILHKTGARREAVEPLLVAVRAGLGKEAELENLCAELGGLGRDVDCLDVAKRWTERFPKNARAWNTRAWIQVDPEGDPRLRDPEDGVRSAEQALNLTQTGDAGMLDTYACALHAAGQRGKAIENVRMALELAVEAGFSAQDIEAIEGHLRTFEAMPE